MIRTLAVLAGGFLGFAAALMLADSSSLEPYDVTLDEPDRVLTAERKPKSVFETDPTSPTVRTPYEPFLDESPRSDSFDSLNGTAGDVVTYRVDRSSDLYRLQFELARLDCFDGSIDGRWSLSFHESLANVVLTRELDIGALENAENVLIALRATDPGVCRNVEHDVDALHAPQQSGNTDPEKKFASVSSDKKSNEIPAFVALPVRKKSEELIRRAEIKTQNPVRKPKFAPYVIVGTRHMRRDHETSPSIAPAKTVSVALEPPLVAIVRQQQSQRRTYTYPKLAGRHADEILVVSRTIEIAAAPDAVAGSQDIKSLDETDVRVEHEGQILPTAANNFSTAIVEESRKPLADGVRPTFELEKAPKAVHHAGLVSKPDLMDPVQIDFDTVSLESPASGTTVDLIVLPDMPLPVRRPELRFDSADTLPVSATRRNRQSVRATAQPRKAAVKARAAPAKKSKPLKAKKKKAWKDNRKAIFNGRG